MTSRTDFILNLFLGNSFLQTVLENLGVDEDWR